MLASGTCCCLGGFETGVLIAVVAIGCFGLCLGLGFLGLLVCCFICASGFIVVLYLGCCLMVVNLGFLLELSFCAFF